MAKLCLALALALAPGAHADDAAVSPVLSLAPSIQQPSAPALPQAPLQAAALPLAVSPALSAARDAAGAAPSAPRAAPGAMTELRQGAADSGRDAAKAPVELRKRFDGGGAKADTLDQEIAQAAVSHNVGPATFSMSIAGQTAYLQYRLRQDRLIILHTEVPTALEGHGVGGRIVKAALEYAREKGMKVNPLCPFAAAYIERHPEYQPLLHK